jgi:L-threonylcarbamoyladenylate synthase
MMENFGNDIENCLGVLSTDGLILYPTDTIWGIGCDATNVKAVEKIYKLKQRDDNKSMIILVSDQKELRDYADVSPEILEYLSTTSKPTTVIYQNGKNIASNLMGSDGTIAIRVVKDPFCRELIAKFNKPIVSTSANISGEPFPQVFDEVAPAIKNGVDYIVQHRRRDLNPSQPSSIIKLTPEGKIEMIRL